MDKKILEKAEETLSALTLLWDELGFRDAVRRQQLADLNKKLETVYDELLHEMKAVRDQYRNNIERCKTKIQDVCLLLEESIPNLESSTAKSEGLMDTYARLAEILESLYRVRRALSLSNLSHSPPLSLFLPITNTELASF
jgi:hypothetical protein